eukprot:TRINITY_DN85814_c0_g1_i1.p1 TRINITY_DN85814_c0_g1~~TRINITY_DN85814_c0_g1_i1.p1  ORF type:complete len:156 (+),score=28.34 TRINITY_DN85814_c0_g1_i1:57-524(+)
MKSRSGTEPSSPGALRSRNSSGAGASARRLSWKDDGSVAQAMDKGAPSQASKPSTSLDFLRRGVNGDQGHVERCSSEKIDDRRATPSRADHHNIVNSLQQGLGNVDSLIVYDPEHDSDDEGENDVTWKRRAWLRQLSDFCKHLCNWECLNKARKN